MAKDVVKILKKFGAESFMPYVLVNNYGYKFSVNGKKYDARFWANCYGAEVNKWRVHPLGQEGCDKKFCEDLEKALNK